MKNFRVCAVAITVVLLWTISLSQFNVRQIPWPYSHISYPINRSIKTVDYKEDLRTLKTAYYDENEQGRRQNTLKQACARLGLNGVLPLKDRDLLTLMDRVKIYFSDKYKLLVCAVPKVGCTNFKKVLVVTEGLTNVSDPRKVNGLVAHEIANSKLLLSQLKNVTEIRRKLREYYKVVTVRDPAHRILSAFRDKFVNGNHSKHYNKMAEEIHNAFSKDTAPLKFEDFVQFVSDNASKRDVHWELFNSICIPCIVDYNYVAKLETITEDVAQIWKAVGISKNMPYPVNYSPDKRTNEERMDEYYGNNTELRRTIYNTYKIDHILFGYPPL